MLRPGSLPFCPLRHHIDSCLLPLPHSHPPHRWLSYPSQRYISDCVAMYCETMLYCHRMHSSVVWNPTSALYIAAEVYSHFLSVFRRGSCTVSRRATWSWNPPQGPSHAGGEHSGLWAEEQHRLHHGFKHKSGHPRLRPLPADNSRHPLPHCPHPWQVPDHLWTVLVCHRDHPTHVSKGGLHLQGDTIGSECPGGECPLLLQRQAPSLTIRSILVLHWVWNLLQQKVGGSRGV